MCIMELHFCKSRTKWYKFDPLKLISLQKLIGIKNHVEMCNQSI